MDSDSESADDFQNLTRTSLSVCDNKNFHEDPISFFSRDMNQIVEKCNIAQR